MRFEIKDFLVWDEKSEKKLYLCSGKSKSVAECQCMRREKRLLEALQVKWQ